MNINTMSDQDHNTAEMKYFWDLPLLIHLAALLGKILPRKAGLWLAGVIGSKIGKNKDNPMVNAIRANQWVIHQGSLSPDELDALPQIIFTSAAKCMFDYFYFISRPVKLHNVVDFSPEVKIAFERIRNNQPCVFVCPHLSNFDLMGYVLTLNGLDVQVLSFPNPTGAYKMQNQLRENLGINVTPMGLTAFRQARKRLKEGGSILTGLDRPLEGNLREKYQPEFFGHTSHLPVTYVRMAKEANAPVMVMAATSQPGGRYQLEGSDLIWMEEAEDLETEIIHNAQKVLRQAEPLIRKFSQQWAMFYPIWPQFLGK